MERETGIENTEGDCLQLNPEKPHSRVPGFAMEKMRGRQTVQEMEEELGLGEGTELALSVEYGGVKKKTPMLVNMDKQVGRREVWAGEEPEGDNVLLPSRSRMEALTRRKDTAVRGVTLDV